MRVGVARERRDGERRVAATPESVRALRDAGYDVLVESGAGAAALATDDAYRDAGAQVADGDVASAGDVLLGVRAPDPERAASLRAGTATISLLVPGDELDTVRALRDARASTFSLNLLPRLSRAQSMDALSSQALVSGYRAVLIAAQTVPRFFPLFMTAAGTVPPARVLVLGAGVAGLQAIATARRLGAKVEAYDVRAAAADEVRSLGASFVELELETQEGGGGYARSQSEEFLAKQRELIGAHVADSDVVITTAAIPGRRAPLLVTTEMVQAMRPGSVLVDLAAESGGNCEPTEPGEQVTVGGALVYGALDLPSSLPVDASRLYAKNAANLLLAIAPDGSAASIAPDFDDELIAGCCVTHDGEIRHGPTRELLADAPAGDRQEGGEQ